MNLKTLLFVLGPPSVVVGALATYNPDALTWPMVAIVAIVVGVFGALVQRLLED